MTHRCPGSNNVLHKKIIRASKGFIIGCGKNHDTTTNLLNNYSNFRNIEMFSNSNNVNEITNNSLTGIGLIGNTATINLSLSINVANGNSFTINNVLPFPPAVGIFTNLGTIIQGIRRQVILQISRPDTESSATFTISMIDPLEQFNGILTLVRGILQYQIDPNFVIN